MSSTAPELPVANEWVKSVIQDPSEVCAAFTALQAEVKWFGDDVYGLPAGMEGADSSPHEILQASSSQSGCDLWIALNELRLLSLLCNVYK